jgi:hypothetical protein
MQTLDAFLPWVLPKAPGCSTPFANQALVDAAIAFCTESLAIREMQASFPTVAATEAYTLTSTAYEEVTKVLAVKLNGSNLPPMPSEFEPDLVAYSGQPTRYYTRRSAGVLSLVLYPNPDRVYTIQVQVANRPKRGTAQLAEDLYHLWLEPLVAGALSRLQSTAGQPFYDPMSSATNAQIALSGARKARQVTDTGNVQATSMVSPNPWGNR